MSKNKIFWSTAIFFCALLLITACSGSNRSTITAVTTIHNWVVQIPSDLYTVSYNPDGTDQIVVGLYSDEKLTTVMAFEIANGKIEPLTYDGNVPCRIVSTTLECQLAEGETVSISATSNGQAVPVAPLPPLPLTDNGDYLRSDLYVMNGAWVATEAKVCLDDNNCREFLPIDRIEIVDGYAINSGAIPLYVPIPQATTGYFLFRGYSNGQLVCETTDPIMSVGYYSHQYQPEDRVPYMLPCRSPKQFVE